MSASRGFKPLTGIPASDAELEDFAARRGMPTLRPIEPALEKPPATPSPAAPTARLTIELPDYLANELRLRAAQDRCSARYLITQALKLAGYTVADADLVADGRRATGPGNQRSSTPSP